MTVPAPKPVMIRPQDKWSGLDGAAATASPVAKTKKSQGEGRWMRKVRYVFSLFEKVQ